MSKPNTIPFGISFRGHRQYTLSEVENFIECADNIEPEALQNKYVAFLEEFSSTRDWSSDVCSSDLLGRRPRNRCRR